MKKLLTVLLTVAMLFTALTAFAEEADTTLNLADIGMFSAGGTVTEPVEGEYDPTQNWMDANRPGNTAHVDHANVLYMTPAEDNGNPIVYLHGYHQIEGEPVQVLHPGDVAFCPPGVKHWHGGGADTRFAHIAINTNPDKTGLEWFDRISEEEYARLSTER